MPQPSESDTTQKLAPETANPADTSLPGLSLFGIEQKWWVLIAVGTGTFMSALDGSVVNTVLPIINSSFQSSVASVEWVVIIYLLVLSGVLLSFGRLGDMRGHKQVYLAGFFIFVISSAMCGLAPSILMLVVFRGLQAFGAAMIAANSPAILTKSFPAEQRGQALGLQATMTYLGLTVGPSLGGWLTQQFSWRAVFYINVPVGILALLLSIRAISRDQHTGQAEPFDITGALVFMAGLIALLLGLNQGQEWGWNSLPILSLLAAAAVFLTVFVFIEQRVANPMLDLTLFQRRLFSASVASAIVNYICLYSILFIMPFYLIEGRSLNPAQAGLLLTAQPIMMAIFAPISGTISDRIGARIPSTVGMAILGGALFLLSRLGPQSPYWMIILFLGIAGLGTGIFISPNNSALLGSAPRHRQGIASGILATSRNVGMVLGIGLSGAIYNTILARGGSQNTLFIAVQYSFLAATGVAFIGFLTSATRGNGENK